MFGGSEDPGYFADSDEHKIIQALKEMGFEEQRIRSAAACIGVEINSSSSDLLTDTLLNNPDIGSAMASDPSRFSTSFSGQQNILDPMQHFGMLGTPPLRSPQPSYFPREPLLGNPVTSNPSRSSPQQSPYPSSQQNAEYVNPSGHRAVQIILPGRTNGYSINQEEIERIFGHPDVANIPVAIYSVAGAFRKGKSFMLNFFLRFLWAKNDNRSESWLQSKQKELNHGFGWRGGSVQHTQGIWLWDEPFFVETRHHKRVALFLMDTQGSFEPGAAVKDCSVIFALSTLISSVQIYNVSQNIQEDTLQHLQLFTEYGKVAKKMRNQGGKSFQDLMFLVRDWSDPEVPYGFGGGEELMHRVFHVQLDHHDIKSVRNNLRDSFENVSCFLMPYPGEKVAVRGQNQGDHLDLADVKPVFKEMVDSLVRRLFSRDKLVVKQVNQSPVTGKDLINFTLAYFNVFRSGKMPEVGTVMQATAKAAILAIIQDCKEVYRRQMKKSCENTYKSDEEIKNTHDMCKMEALYQFDQTPKFGDDLFIKQHRKTLEDLMDQEFDVYKQTNIAEKERMKNEVRDVVAVAEQQYTKGLEDCSSGQYVEKDSINEIDKGCREGALEYFKEQTKKYPRDAVEKNRRKLNELLDQAFKRFKESNNHKQVELRRQLEDKSIQAMQQYRRSMDAKSGDLFLSDAEFDEAHQAAETEALKQFEESDVGRHTDQWTKERERLLLQIEQEEVKYKANNEMNRKLANAKTLETMNEAKIIYKSLMEEACGIGYIDAARLQQTHSDAKEQAKAVISSVEDSKGSEFADKCKSQFNEFLNNEFEKFQRRNENLKQSANNRFKQRKNDAYTRYQQQIDRLTEKYIDERSLGEQHSKEKRNALTYYRRGEEEPRTDFNEIGEELDRDIEKHYQLVLEKNAENKKRAEEMAERVLQEIKDQYLKHMTNLCDGRYVKPDVLRKSHDQYTSNLLQRPMDSPLGEEFNKSYNKRCREELEKLYRTVHKNNGANKGFWVRVVETVIVKPFCDGKYVDPKVLEGEHNKVKEKIENELKPKLVDGAELLKKFMERFKKEIAQLFQQIKANNKKNKPTWIRRLGNVLWETAKGGIGGLIFMGLNQLIKLF